MRPNFFQPQEPAHDPKVEVKNQEAFEKICFNTPASCVVTVLDPGFLGKMDFYS